MTRKARHQADSTTARGTTELTLQQLRSYIDQMLSGLSEREAALLRHRSGLDDGELRTWDELGEIYGVTRERVHQIGSRAFQKLKDRHLDQAEMVLQDLLETDFSGLPHHVKERALGHEILNVWDEQDPFLVFCDRHQSRHLLRSWDKECGFCNCIASRGNNGRPRDYCSNACRQAAYRQRRRDGRSS